AALEKAGIVFAITASGLKDKKDFSKNLQRSFYNGLSHREALKDLTYTPATLLGIYDQAGSLEKGKLANFIICSDSIFSEDNIIYQNWIRGVPYPVNSFDLKDLRGNYTLTAGSLKVSLVIGNGGSFIKLNDTTRLKTTFN